MSSRSTLLQNIYCSCKRRGLRIASPRLAAATHHRLHQSLPLAAHLLEVSDDVERVASQQMPPHAVDENKRAAAADARAAVLKIKAKVAAKFLSRKLWLQASCYAIFFSAFTHHNDRAGRIYVGDIVYKRKKCENGCHVVIRPRRQMQLVNDALRLQFGLQPRNADRTLTTRCLADLRLKIRCTKLAFVSSAVSAT